MSDENVIVSRPLLPVRPTAKMTISPPKSPSLPGVKPVAKAVVASPRPPGTPRASSANAQPLDASRSAEIERRRASLTGTGVVGDPKSTFEMLVIGAKNTLKAIPLLIKKYWWVLLIIGGLWIFCQSFSAETWGNRIPTLRGFFKTITPVVDFLVFLTAAYNGWIAKSIYGLIILKIFVPLIQRFKAEGFKTVIGSFKMVGPGIKTSWASSGTWAVPILVITAGIGIALSNLLTENNSYTRCIVSVALALSMVKFLSDNKKSMPFMVTRVISKDTFKIFKKNTPVKNHHIFVGITGVMIGLSCSIIMALAFFWSLITFNQVQYAGYLIGAVAVVAGVVLYFVQVRGKKSTKQTEGPTQ